MRRIIRRLEVGSERGFSLLEVIIAMFVFAIVSVAAIHSLISVLSVTRDSRNREIAANLASQAIDLARDTADVFQLQDIEADDAGATYVLNGETFTVTRETNWVSNPDIDEPCGQGGGIIRYKKVNIKVVWEHMRGSQPVRADTLINPNTRINDPQMGTILVSVHNEAGSGIPGVSVSASVGSPANGAQPLTVTPTATDSEGCTYILKVAPGNYDVTISKTGYMSGETSTDPLDPGEQTASPKALLVPVAASTSVSVEFEYDQKGTYQVAYYSNPAPGSTMIPKDLDTSFVNGRGVSYSKASTASFSRTIDRFPYGAGYTVLAGKYSEATELSDGCLSPNPGAWIDGTLNGNPVVGLQPEPYSAAPAGSVAAVAPMGIVQITNMTNRWIRATTVPVANKGPGDPGCSVTMVYMTDKSTSSTARVALPYGTWTFEYSTTGTSGWTSISSGISLVTQGTLSSNRATLDPRTTP